MTLADYRAQRGEPLTESPAPGHEEHHPTTLQYIQIGLVLAVITAIEVGLYYIDMSHDLLVALLIVLSVAKFSLVVLWFMHLKFDSRLFGTLFMVGLSATAILFTIVIAIEGGSLV